MEQSPEQQQQQQQRSQSPRPEGAAVLRLYGLPYSIKEEKIREFFGSFSLADEEPIVFFVEGLHRGTGFVRLRNAEDAALAINRLHRQNIDETRYVEISTSSEEERQRIMEQQEQSNKACVLRLRGLPFAATEDDVRTFIESMEGVLSIDICRDMDGRNTGDAFIELASEEDVKRVKLLHSKAMGNRYIEVLPSTVYDRDAIMRASSQRSRRGRRSGRGYEISVTDGDVSHHQGHESMMVQRIIDPFVPTTYEGYMQPLGFGGQRPFHHQYHNNHHHAQHHSAQMQNYYHNHQHHRQAQQFHHYSPHNNSFMNPRGGGDGRDVRYSMNNQPYRRFSDERGIVGGGGIVAEGPSAPYPPGAGGAPPPPFLPVFPGQSSLVVARQPSPFVVRIRGVPYSASEEAIAEFFAGVKIPPQGVHMVYDERNRLTGEAFVEVEDRNDVLLALDRNGAMMGTRYIEVFESSPAAMQRLGTAQMGMMSYPMVPQMFC
ncbi:heterogeneous nuclear ribonucleoprotein H/F, putative [Trypanosoma equiperdum]|uniref:Heterogeneous nuclear ribonucleoprotein H/F, putative n=2 Tax=Trypanozoon TaxID=39700 RepID=Q586X0_TRYB2|nr:heterogeneous nuclear ribonucleoprotein H/F, putative [Trypanosoma brucei brucei TREU927]AAQ15845.1 heterogeneous nuclear ribonucleoprotein H/F, putative [Trypanosoma brucei brucei TREU927]AAX79621.1 heterogeneous nuclear ribonucleoprotein H/F, putative [Trypanosoma brucei]SCU71199.1 heterogeneous nuclear ribonucleoprotein H/F, putative [Trypanosoma equiperdum]